MTHFGGLFLNSLTVLLLLLAIGPVSAQLPPPATPLSLEEAVDLAIRDNAELKSQRARLGAMRERPAQAGSLPNPMFTYSGMDTASGGSWPDTNEKRYMLQQEFPWFGKRGLREGLAVKDAEVMQRDLETMTRDVVLMVKESCFDLATVQQVIAITRDEEAVLRRLAQAAETLYATGDRAQADVLKAQSEITMLKQKLLELQAQENTLGSKLNTLLNRRADAPVGPVATPPDSGLSGDLAPLLALGVTNRPEVLAAQAQVDRSALERQLMAKESVPDYKLGVEYREYGTSEDEVMFTVSVDLPVWRSKYRAAVREAEQMSLSSQAAREAAERRCALDVQDAAFKLQSARRTLALTRTELLPQAEARFKASESAYRTGKADFTDLLESERFQLSVRIMAAMAQGTVGAQAARLERALGIPFPPHPIAEGAVK